MQIKKLELNKKNSINYLLWGTYLLCTLIMLAYYLYYNRYVVLACHDSMMEFAYAKIYGWKWAYKYSFEFLLSRGRASFIFPGVICFRFFVHQYGNYLAVWMLQYVPIYINIILLSAVISKRVHSTYGVMYSLFFISFLQINVWHSLIICYPLEFMYALSLMIWGLILYQSYLEKPKVWKMALSLIFFYESMQSYEAFLVSSLCYAILALNWTLKLMKGQGFKNSLLKFIKILIPHIIVALIFVAIFVYLHIHPAFPDRAVLDVEDHGTLEGAIKTWFNFSCGMLPLKNLLDIRDLARSKMDLRSFRNIFVMFVCGAASLAGVILTYKNIESKSKEEINKINRTLIVLGAMGLAIACTFALPHSLTGTYQLWVMTGGSLSYVPTTICYFGWCVFLVCALGIALNFVANKRKAIKVTVSIVLAGFFAVGGMMTICINDAFRELPATTNAYASVKAQVFYALCIDDTFDDWDIDVLYTPVGHYMGIHSDIERDETLMEAVVGDDYDVEILNNSESFFYSYKDYSNPAMFFYDFDAKVGILIHVDNLVITNYTTKNFYVETSGEARIISAHGGSYVLNIDDQEFATFSNDSWSGTTIVLPDNVHSNQIDIIMR